MIGQTISHYKILEPLGGGGMGIVYKARDLRLDRSVALKFLPPELTRDPEARKRFVYEAKAASALQHDNVCVIHDIDQTADGQTFIVLEFYDGRTIKKEIAGGPLPVARAIDIAIQVGEGLAEAHRHGIVHRDIKPANVILTRQGKAKVVDFGLAILTGMTRLTSENRRVGTITHMSPEQARGDQVDHRTDIWSLGVLLYEMIAGRLPFASSYEQAVVYSILNTDPPPLSSFRPEIPPRLDDILRKALAKDPGSRYQDTDEMIEDLREIGGLPTGTSVPPPRGRSWIIPIGAAIFVLIVAGVWLLRGSRTERSAVRSQVTLQLLNFRNESHEARGDEWARLVQHTYLPNAFADNPDVLVFQEGSSRSEVNFMLNGDIVQAESSFVLQLRLQEPESGRLRYAAGASFRKPDELEGAAASASHNLLWFLQIRVLNKDLDPWLPRMISDSASIAFLKAMTYILTGEAGGRVFLDETIRLDSTFVAPRVWLIPSLVSRNETQARSEAESHYRVLQSLKSGVTPFELSMIELAGCYLYGNLQCRATALEKGLRFAPGNRIVLENLGLAYYRLEKYDQAVEAYAPIVRSDMPYPPAYPEYARALIRMKRFDEARAVIDKALAMPPVNADTYCLLAAFAWKDGDSAKARSYELRFLEGMTDSKRAWGVVFESLGRTLLDMDELRLAVRFLLEAEVERPGDATPRSALARALVLSGESAAGEQEALSALGLNEACAEAHEALGQLYLQRGLVDRARSHFRKYLELDSLTVTALTIQRRLGEIESTPSAAR